LEEAASSANDLIVIDASATYTTPTGY